MVQITLKAKHYYFISYYLRMATIEQYFSLISRFKTAMSSNTDLEQTFIVDAYPGEIIAIYRILTLLPEGQSNSINDEMSLLLEPQIQNGVANEIANGLFPDADGNIPENAYWQQIGYGIQETRTNNQNMRNVAIDLGKSLIDSI
jgi:hypothetical protein